MRIGGTDARFQIRRLRNGRAGNGCHPLDERHARGDSLPYGRHSAHVLDKRANGHRQPARRDFPPGDSIDLLFLGALRILGLEHNHLHIVIHVSEGLLHGGNGLGLIVLDGHADVLDAENMAHNLDASADIVGLLEHQSVIGSEVWLAFRAVDEKRIDGVAGRRRELYVSGEARTAHARHSCIG